MSEENKAKLFEEFPPVSSEAWEAVVTKDLKGADFDKKLVWRTYEGFNLQPYYREEDLANISHLGSLPGEAPYLRGNKKSENSWLIRQDIKVEDVEEANKKAIDVLMKGVTSLGFDVDGKILSPVEFKKLLNDVCLKSAEVNFVAASSSFEVLELLKSEIAERNYAKEDICASVDLDPIGYYLTLRGNFCEDCADPFEKVAEIVEKSKDLPKVKSIAVHGDYYKNAGSGIVQELAFSLASAAEYLEKTSEKGVSVEDIASKIKFHFAVGNVYFMEIAKLRAARFLWSKLQESFGVKAQKMDIHSVTTRWNKTIYDPYVNMLRTTTEGMAAAIGGTDSLTIEPFNAVFEKTTEFSERIARNQQNLLNEESYFSKIADPAAGSYYIESITASLIEHAWNLFLEVQEKGGYIEAFKAGFIQSKIKETATKKDKMIAQRRENVLGVNQFPNFTEYAEKELDELLFEPADFTEDNAIAETLKLYRGAQPIEALRYETDKYSKDNKRPKAFMLTIGNLTMRKARSLFSCNFFACAGFEVVDNNGFETIADGVKEAKAQNADIIVICSSDDEYASFGPEAKELLGEKQILVIAGAPACADELKEKGITNFINVKTNLLETLKFYQEELGIA